MTNKRYINKILSIILALSLVIGIWAQCLSVFALTMDDIRSDTENYMLLTKEAGKWQAKTSTKDISGFITGDNFSVSGWVHWNSDQGASLSNIFALQNDDASSYVRLLQKSSGNNDSTALVAHTALDGDVTKASKNKIALDSADYKDKDVFVVVNYDYTNKLVSIYFNGTNICSGGKLNKLPSASALNLTKALIGKSPLGDDKFDGLISDVYLSKNLMDLDTMQNIIDAGAPTDTIADEQDEEGEAEPVIDPDNYLCNAGTINEQGHMLLTKDADKWQIINGDDNQVTTVPIDDDFIDGDNYTLYGWAYLNTAAANAHLVLLTCGDVWNRFYLSSVSTLNHNSYNGSVDYYAGNAGGFSAKTPFFFTLVYDATNKTQSIYINGELKSSATNQSLSAAKNLGIASATLGQSLWAADPILNGSLAGVYLANGAFSNAEIEELMNNNPQPALTATSTKNPVPVVPDTIKVEANTYDDDGNLLEDRSILTDSLYNEIVLTPVNKYKDAGYRIFDTEEFLDDADDFSFTTYVRWYGNKNWYNKSLLALNDQRLFDLFSSDSTLTETSSGSEANNYTNEFYYNGWEEDFTTRNPSLSTQTEIDMADEEAAKISAGTLARADAKSTAFLAGAITGVRLLGVSEPTFKPRQTWAATQSANNLPYAWAHVAVVYDHDGYVDANGNVIGAKISYYLDGDLYAYRYAAYKDGKTEEDYKVKNLDLDTLYLGKSTATKVLFNGYVKNTYLYKTAVSTDDIAVLYQDLIKSLEFTSESPDKNPFEVDGNAYALVDTESSFSKYLKTGFNSSWLNSDYARNKNALLLKGNGSYVDIPSAFVSGDVNSNVSSDKLTFSTWLKVREDINWGRLLDIKCENGGLFLTSHGYFNGDSDVGLGIRQYTVDENGNEITSENVDIYAAPALPTNVWANVAVVIDGKTVKIYLQGELCVTQEMSMTLSEMGEIQSIYIGRSGAVDEHYKLPVDDDNNILIDQTFIFQSALTDQNIHDLAVYGYNAPSSPYSEDPHAIEAIDIDELINGEDDRMFITITESKTLSTEALKLLKDNPEKTLYVEVKKGISIDFVWEIKASSITDTTKPMELFVSETSANASTIAKLQNGKAAENLYIKHSGALPGKFKLYINYSKDFIDNNLTGQLKLYSVNTGLTALTLHTKLPIDNTNRPIDIEDQPGYAYATISAGGEYLVTAETM